MIYVESKKETIEELLDTENCQLPEVGCGRVDEISEEDQTCEFPVTK